MIYVIGNFSRFTGVFPTKIKIEVEAGRRNFSETMSNVALNLSPSYVFFGLMLFL